MKRFFLLGLLISTAAGAADVTADSLGFASQGATSVTDLFKGKISGVKVSGVDGNINGLVDVTVRGVNTVRGREYSQPLYVIDGIMLNTGINANLDGFRDMGPAGYCAPTNPLAFISPYDIEKIEVLKNASATAAYGAKGASGVVLITTRHDRSDGLNIRWNSNVALNIPGVKASGLAPSVAHNHYVSLSGSFSKTLYYLSAQYRNANGVVFGNRSDYVTVTTGIDAVANDFMQFGMRAILSMGKAFNTSGMANYGYSSAMTTIRGITDCESLDAWRDGYDDEIQDSRVAANVYFNVKLAKGLVWKNTLGIDFHSYNRFLWYGKSTAFGSQMGGVTSVLGNTLFRDNFKTSFEYGRYFGKHRLDVAINGEQFYLYRKYNGMEGSTFFSEALRERGLSISGAFGNPQIYVLPMNQLSAGALLAYDYDRIVGAKATFTASFTKELLDGPELFPSAELYFDAGRLFLDGKGAVSGLRFDAGYGWSGNTSYIPAEVSALVPAEAAHFYKSLSQILSKEWHASLSAGFLADRLKIGVTYFDRTSEDKVSLLCFGRKPSEPNALWEKDERKLVDARSSTIGNKGYELDLSAAIMKRARFQWNASLNFAYNANRMVSVASEDILSDYTANVVGYPTASLFGLNEETGVVELLGNPVPKFHGGLSTDFRIGDLYVDMLFEGAASRSVLNLNRMLADGVAYPSSSYVEDASYLRLTRLSLGYTIPLGLKFVKSFDVKLSGGNLFTLSRYSGWNPDVSGLDYGSYPYVRSVILGISVKF